MRKFTLANVLHFLLILVLTGISTAYSQENNPSRTEDYRYEDWYTFKHGKTFTADPYVWVYTREFAQMFRMPEQWIDDTLKGALAVSFRMTTVGNLMCGYGGQETSCWPLLECQIDIYYDNRIKLPWVREEISRDFLMRGISSHEFLYDPSKSKGIRRYIPKDPREIRGVLASGGVIKVGKYQSAEAQVAYFDREFQPRIGLIGWIGGGVCPRPVGTGYMHFYDEETSQKINRMQIKPENVKPLHVIEFPKSFMQRANAVYEVQSKQNKEAAQKLIKQFFELRQPPGRP